MPLPGVSASNGFRRYNSYGESASRFLQRDGRTLAISWLSVALGMVSDSVETASNLPMFLVFLPFLSSGFVPTDSMPDGLSWFAEHQPFTPLIETVRGLLLGTPIGDSGLLAVGWCVVISVAGYLWARRLYERNLVR